MKIIPSNSNCMRRAQDLMFAVPLLAALLLPQTLRASLPIEEVQREFQARYYFINGSYVQWPACACQTPAPAFPTNGFYGDLDHNPVLAVQLVQDLANKFFPGYNPLYGNFLNTPDGSSGIDGQASPPPNYTDTDFPTSVNGVDLTLVTMDSYPNCFPILRGYIETLNYVLGSAGPVNLATKENGGAGASTNSCDEAKQLASNDPSSGWNSNTNWDPVPSALRLHRHPPQQRLLALGWRPAPHLLLGGQGCDARPGLQRSGQPVPAPDERHDPGLSERNQRSGRRRQPPLPVLHG